MPGCKSTCEGIRVLLCLLLLLISDKCVPSLLIEIRNQRALVRYRVVPPPLDLVIILPSLAGGVWLVSAFALQRTMRALLGYHRHMYEPIGKPSRLTKLWIVRSCLVVLAVSRRPFSMRRPAGTTRGGCTLRADDDAPAGGQPAPVRPAELSAGAAAASSARHDRARARLLTCSQ